MKINTKTSPLIEKEHHLNQTSTSIGSKMFIFFFQVPARFTYIDLIRIHYSCSNLSHSLGPLRDIAWKAERDSPYGKNMFKWDWEGIKQLWAQRFSHWKKEALKKTMSVFHVFVFLLHLRILKNCNLVGVCLSPSWKMLVALDGFPKQSSCWWRHFW